MLDARRTEMTVPEAAGLPSEPPNAATDAETWVLQSEAAARTGFSVSAIRKWRRMGVVAERKTGPGGDLARVEVRLEDVLARAALQPQRQPLPTQRPDLSAPSGTLIIGIDDLEALFERMVRAERRAEAAEAEVVALQAAAKYTFGQLAELRRQLQCQSESIVDDVVARAPRFPDPATVPEPPPTSRSNPDPPPPAVVVSTPDVTPGTGRVSRASSGTATGTGSRTGTGTGTGTSTGTNRLAPPRPTAPSAAALDPTGRATKGPAAGPPDVVEELVNRLRSVYARLDEYRREPTISPSHERRRQAELREYDGILLTLLPELGIQTGLDPRAPLSVDARARLTSALARAGFDVRAAPGAARSRFRWQPARREH